MHAGVVIAEHDRDALERLCRYGARPTFALKRLAWTGHAQTLLGELRDADAEGGGLTRYVTPRPSSR
jgi:hypothetical protein